MTKPIKWMLNLDLICSSTSSRGRPSCQLRLKFSPVGKIFCETRCQTGFPEKKGENPVLKQNLSLFVFHMFRNQPMKWSRAAVINLGYGYHRGYVSCLRGYANCPILMIVSYLEVLGSKRLRNADSSASKIDQLCKQFNRKIVLRKSKTDE